MCTTCFFVFINSFNYRIARVDVLKFLKFLISDTFIRWNTGVNSFQGLLQKPRLQGCSSRNFSYRVFLLGTSLLGFSFRNHAYRGSLPGTMLIGVLFQNPRLQGFFFQELRLQGFSFRNHAYRVFFQKPCLQVFSSRNHAYKGSILGTHIGLYFRISSWFYRHMRI